MIYIVFYEIIGSRCNGTYLVNAATAAKAKKLVLAIDEDYVCRGSCVTRIGKLEVLAAMSDDELKMHEDFYLTRADLNAVKKENSTVQLEEGT